MKNCVKLNLKDCGNFLLGLTIDEYDRNELLDWTVCNVAVKVEYKNYLMLAPKKGHAWSTETYKVFLLDDHLQCTEYLSDYNFSLEKETSSYATKQSLSVCLFFNHKNGCSRNGQMPLSATKKRSLRVFDFRSPKRFLCVHRSNVQWSQSVATRSVYKMTIARRMRTLHTLLPKNIVWSDCVSFAKAIVCNMSRHRYKRRETITWSVWRIYTITVTLQVTWNSATLGDYTSVWISLGTSVNRGVKKKVYVIWLWLTIEEFEMPPRVQLT